MNQSTNYLHQILQLNTRLTGCDSEARLLDEAVSGICRILDLVDVTIFEWQNFQWSIRTTTSGSLNTGKKIPAELAPILTQLTAQTSEQIIKKIDQETGPTGRLASPLIVGDQLLGAVISHTGPNHDLEEVALLVQTFSLNLAILWHKLSLFLDTQKRARQLEALHSRQIDTIQQGDSALLIANYENRVLEFERRRPDQLPESNNHPAHLELTIPMVVGDRPIGDLSLPADISLDEEETDFIEALLREMGNALNNAQLLQTTRSYSAQLQVAADVSRAAGTILDRDILIREVVNLVRDSFDLYYVGLFLINDDDDAVLMAGTGEAGTIQIEQGHKLKVGGASMVGKAVSLDQAIVEQDVTQAAEWRPNPYLPDTRSELALPLRTRGRTIGALTVQSQNTGAFTQENITVLQTVADQMATAIENASLFVQIQENLADTNRLYQSGRKISESTDKLSVYQELINFVAESNMFDLAHIIMPDPTSPDYLISPVLWSRHEVEFNPLDRFPRKRFSFSEQLTNSDIIIVADALTDETIDDNTRQLFIRNKVRSAAMIPIHSENRWLATLILDRQEPNPPTRQELQPFLTLCDQAAIILDNQQLLNETEALYRVSRALNYAGTADEIYDLTLNEVAQYTGLEQCHIVIYDEYLGYGRIVDMYKEDISPTKSWLPMEGDKVYKRLIKEKRPLLVQKGHQDTNRSACEIYLEPLGLQASMLIPALSKGNLIGYIALDSYAGTEYFHRTNINYTQAVADQFTIALESIRRYEEIRQANERLRELDQLKTQFLANMSHELRTPLNSIIGFSRVILKGIDGPITAEQEEDLSSIHNSGQHLLSLINDILDVARIEAGKMTLAFEDVNIEEMANSVNATIRGLVKDKDIELNWQIEQDLPPIEADPIRLRQILLNFLSNAAKFTEQGRISLYIFKDGDHHVHLAIQDTGIGIAEEDFDVLFEAFEQVDSSVTRSYGGTGLGLPITKKLVELHQGNVWLESEIGRGTVFHVVLPIRQDFADISMPEQSRFLEINFNTQSDKRDDFQSQPTILIVDDEPGVVGLYERYLRAKPYQIWQANSGAEALQTMLENDGLIQLVLLDINMPGLTGWDVLKEMNDNPKTREIPVIVCSIENEPDKAASLGARQSLLKPIVEDDLLHALQTVGIDK